MRILEPSLKGHVTAQPRSHAAWRRLVVALSFAFSGACLDGRSPRAADLQLVALSARLDQTTSDVQLRKLVAEYPLLRVIDGPGNGRVTVRTPPRFGAKDWVALVEFTPDRRILRIAYGMTDYAPLRPQYADAVPRQMPDDRCFGTPAQCAAPWFQTHSRTDPSAAQ
jgi:hypothetical protein